MMTTQHKNIILDQAPLETYKIGQEVQLIIKKQTDLGYKAIVDQKYWGVLYYNEVFKDLHKDQEVTGYIKKCREDGRLDLTLYKSGMGESADIAAQILNLLQDTGGYLELTSQSDAEQIYEIFGVSKKKFKMALGGLYKKRLIVIKEDGIYLPS